MFTPILSEISFRDCGTWYEAFNLPQQGNFIHVESDMGFNN